MYIRKQNFIGSGRENLFFWGARQTGKSTLLKKLYPESLYFDLLLSSEYEQFVRNGSRLREIVAETDISEPVIIDEIQRIPSLLKEVHWLIVNRNIQFILCGSSPRKILRSGGNLLYLHAKKIATKKIAI